MLHRESPTYYVPISSRCRGSSIVLFALSDLFFHRSWYRAFQFSMRSPFKKKKGAHVSLLCIPLTCGLSRPSERVGRPRLPAPAPAPAPAPYIPKRLGRRKRALSQGFEGRINAGRNRAHSQMQSMFFNLPAELRNQIYKECLGGFIFNLVIPDNHLRRSLSSFRAEPVMGKRYLSLPLACRLM
jgi:hypothetical protein